MLNSNELLEVIYFLNHNQNNQAYAFSLEEIITGTGLQSLTKQKLSSCQDIEMRIVNEGEYYRYEPIRKRVLKALNELLAEGKITYNNGLYSLSKR